MEKQLNCLFSYSFSFSFSLLLRLMEIFAGQAQLLRPQIRSAESIKQTLQPFYARIAMKRGECSFIGARGNKV